MMDMKKYLPLLALVAFGAHADDAKITAKLKAAGVKEIRIAESPIAGVRTVSTDQGIFYVSEDGRYFIQGGMIELDDQGNVIDHSTPLLLERLKELQGDAVVYPAKDEKYAVTAFFDYSCGFCQKMHREISQYNDLGITVRYLAFPRGGLTDRAARRMETVFNSPDKAQAMNDLENGKLKKETPVNKVEKHYQLGILFGVQGTPSLILPSGKLVPGYVSAPDLLYLLQEDEG